MAEVKISTKDIMDTLQDFKQMTSDGFLHIENRMDKLGGRMDKLDGRMDKLDGRMDALDDRMDKLENSFSTLNQTVNSQSRELSKINHRLDAIEDKLDMHYNDIKDILLTLYELSKKVDISDAERKLAAVTLKHLVEWANLAAKKIGVPLNIAN